MVTTASDQSFPARPGKITCPVTLASPGTEVGVLVGVGVGVAVPGSGVVVLVGVDVGV